jgi:hypothetical protein
VKKLPPLLRAKKAFLLIMPDNDDYGFFVQLYEDVEGVATYTGINFESGVLGEEVPRSGELHYFAVAQGGL